MTRLIMATTRPAPRSSPSSPSHGTNPASHPSAAAGHRSATAARSAAAGHRSTTTAGHRSAAPRSADLAGYEGHRDQLNHVRHGLGIGHLSVEDDLGADLADLDLGSPGTPVGSATPTALRVESDPDQERHGTLRLVPDGQAGRAERSAIEIQEP